MPNLSKVWIFKLGFVAEECESKSMMLTQTPKHSEKRTRKRLSTTWLYSRISSPHPNNTWLCGIPLRLPSATVFAVMPPLPFGDSRHKQFLICNGVWSPWYLIYVGDRGSSRTIGQSSHFSTIPHPSVNSSERYWYCIKLSFVMKGSGFSEQVRSQTSPEKWEHAKNED